MELPKFGIGTHTLKGEDCSKAVLDALRSGIRMIDTASVYQNEESVGNAIVESGVRREDLFVISKANPREMKRGYRGIIEACLATLERLRTSYLDVYLLHWPGIAGEPPQSEKHRPLRIECWRAMSELQESGKCRHVGVSNFLIPHMQDLLSMRQLSSSTESVGSASFVAPIFLNQMELHPLCQQDDVVSYCQAHNVAVQQYSPVAKGETALMSHPLVVTILKECFLDKVFEVTTTTTTSSSSSNVETVRIESPFDLCLLWGLWNPTFNSLVVRSTQTKHMERLTLLHHVARNLGPEEEDALQRLTDGIRGPQASDMHTCWFSDAIS